MSLDNEVPLETKMPRQERSKRVDVPTHLPYHSSNHDGNGIRPTRSVPDFDEFIGEYAIHGNGSIVKEAVGL